MVNREWIPIHHTILTTGKPMMEQERILERKIETSNDRIRVLTSEVSTLRRRLENLANDTHESKLNIGLLEEVLSLKERQK